MADALERRFLGSGADGDENAQEEQRRLGDQDSLPRGGDVDDPPHQPADDNDGQPPPELLAGAQGKPVADAPRTGPKGVKADYEQYLAFQRQQLQDQQRERYARNTLGQGYRSTGTPETRTLFTTTEPRSSRFSSGPTQGNCKYAAADDKLKNDQAVSDHDDDDEDLDALLNDPAVLREYQRSRLAEWESQNLLLRNQKTFGRVEDVTADDYATTLDDEASHITVLVHVYEDHVPACRHLNRVLDGLAAGPLIHVRVLRIRASDTASESFTPEVLPILMVYKDGCLLESFVRVTDQLPEGQFEGEDVMDLLSLDQ
ncbi:Phosducin-like protein 3 [Tieghemiomyces parasiticus]|uniref:Phosducin-like protein 3 n=1 Tax=Tieghemiomyces parasiticus TaxID=78921 RepID=A0A9W8DNE1_9FUNG|nr:Phosducin-like protein 3 [Tieghemiomyces parasiticus]